MGYIFHQKFKKKWEIKLANILLYNLYLVRMIECVYFLGFMEIARFIVIFVVFVLMFNFVEIINAVLIPPMMNVASVRR